MHARHRTTQLLWVIYASPLPFPGEPRLWKIMGCFSGTSFLSPLFRLEFNRSQTMSHWHSNQSQVPKITSFSKLKDPPNALVVRWTGHGQCWSELWWRIRMNANKRDSKKVTKKSQMLPLNMDYPCVKHKILFRQLHEAPEEKEWPNYWVPTMAQVFCF